MWWKKPWQPEARATFDGPRASSEKNSAPCPCLFVHAGGSLGFGSLTAVKKLWHYATNDADTVVEARNQVEERRQIFFRIVPAGGQPVLLQDSQAVCAPTGTPLTVVVTQVRVRGM